MPLRAPSFRCLQRKIADPEAFVDVVSANRLFVDLYGRMTRTAKVEQFQSPQWAMDFSETHVTGRVRGDLPGGWSTFGLIRSCTTSRWSGQEGVVGMLLCNPPGIGLDGVVAPAFAWTSISIPLEIWEEASRLAGVQTVPLLGFSAWMLPPPLFRHLERRMEEVRELMRAALRDPLFYPSADRAMIDLARSVATLVWEKVASPLVPPTSLQSRVRLARRAETWMRDRLEDAISIPDVCLALRVSRRELEYAFNATFDSSPRAFLHKLRLNAIRRVLRRGHIRGVDASVTEVAMDHGVTHLGRFSSEYRQLFGESPAMTLGTRR